MTSRPCYQTLLASGELARRAQTAAMMLAQCTLCPRQCGVDRPAGERGVCRTGRWARVASYGPHFGEEAPLVGSCGSGTIFFSHCSLLCVFCQNYEISHLGEGVEVEPGQLAAMMLSLEKQGCHNINFVTPGHVVAQILEALVIAADNGLSIPLVYNSSGYDRVETLALLDGVIDIYMPDFKFWEPASAERFAEAPDYPLRARQAVAEMHRQVGDLECDPRGLAIRGLLVRHLVMPEGVEESREIMEFLGHDISRNTYVNIMDQYRPCGRASEFPPLNRTITREEYDRVVALAWAAGLTRLDERDLPLFLRKVLRKE